VTIIESLRRENVEGCGEYWFAGWGGTMVVQAHY